MSLIVQSVFKHFGQQAVLADINFEVQPGEVIALLGSSGAGKTTLLRCLNLLEIPDSGSLQLGGQRWQFGTASPAIQPALLRAWRQQVGMVFQQFNLWPHLTVLKNLILAPVLLDQMNEKQATQEAMGLLEDWGIQQKAHLFPDHLSVGQKQRVAILRALMLHPKVLLLDEPTSALDPERVQQVAGYVRRLARQGMTVLLTTHELGFVKQAADRVFFMEHGAILESGSVQQLFEHPKTERWKEFLLSAFTHVQHDDEDN